MSRYKGASLTGGNIVCWLRLLRCAAALGLVVVAGCATHPAKLDRAPGLTNREELLRNLGPPLRVEPRGEVEVWHYQRRYWNLFTLTSSTWKADYKLDALGKVCDIEIAESSSSRRLWPRTKLPKGFEEFK
jgi:hypothetical protein